MRLQIGLSQAYGVACPSLMEEIIRNEDPIPRREEPKPWAEYLKLHKASGGLLTS